MVLIKGEQVIKIQPKVMQLLLYMADNPDQVLLREELIEKVWPQISATDDTLNNMIGKLRRVLVADDICENYIETIPKKGYRLKAPIKRRGLKHSIESNANRNKIRYVFVTISILVAALLTLNFLHTKQSVTISLEKLIRTDSVTSHQELEVFPELSPNGNQLAFIRVKKGLQSNKLIVKNLSSGNERTLNDIAGLYGNPVWSPDGNQIAYIHMVGSICTVRIVSHLGGPSRFLTGCSGELVRTLRKSLIWTQDKNYLIITKNQQNKDSVALFRINTTNGKQQILSVPSGEDIGDSNPAMSPDNTRLAFTRTASNGFDKIIVRDLNNQSEIEFEERSGAILGLDWTSNNSLVFIKANNNRSELTLLNTENSTVVYSGVTGNNMLHPNYHPKTKQLVFSELQNNANIVIRNNSNSPNADNIIELQSSKFEREAALSHDGKFLVYVRLLPNGSELWRYNLNDQQHQRLVKPEGLFFSHISISPNNNKVVLSVTADDSSEIRIYDIERQHFYPLTMAEVLKPLNPSWSVDGENIIFTSKENGKWSIWKSSLKSQKVKLVTEQGGNIAFEDDEGKNIYFSKLNEAGLWKVSLLDKIASVKKLTDKITAPFQTWKLRDGLFYFLKRESVPSTQIFVYDPKTNDVEIYYEGAGSFNYFDMRNDILATAELKEFNADIYLMKFK